MATTESPLERRIRERSEELRSVLTGRKLDLVKIKEGMAKLGEAGIVDESTNKLVDAVITAVDTVLGAVTVNPQPPVSKK